ncbi:hypothetical protein EJ08DRAFT_656565 [Tothia fuscella]|uniref:Uncharacterized protein n=1 Tax=Tothia fuscella TaxID=1048955 RepID=A0A9P4P1G7_9PEZI|nr:hypothetical protein EJ08DRAFT_656565 [Tothia fuscella]
MSTTIRDQPGKKAELDTLAVGDQIEQTFNSDFEVYSLLSAISQDTEYANITICDFCRRLSTITNTDEYFTHTGFKKAKALFRRYMTTLALKQDNHKSLPEGSHMAIECGGLADSDHWGDALCDLALPKTIEKTDGSFITVKDFVEAFDEYVNDLHETLIDVTAYWDDCV